MLPLKIKIDVGKPNRIEGIRAAEIIDVLQLITRIHVKMRGKFIANAGISTVLVKAGLHRTFPGAGV
jgi:hypothetical protein